MGRRRIRLRDIASRTGFSANTVSLALRDSPRIAESTRELIRNAAAELDYVPNGIARSLVNRQSMTVGLLLTVITNPILMRVAQEVGKTLAGHGYATLFATSNNEIAAEIDAIETFRARQVDGILMYPTDHRETAHMSALRERGFPIVSLAADPMGALDAVSVDEHAGARKVTGHLLAGGRKRIALLDAAAPLGNTEKLAGYLAAHGEAGIPTDPDLQFLTDGHGMETGYQTMSAMFAKGIDAVLASNDSLALGVARWCEDNGVQVPGDIAIAGFDDIEYARFASITTVAYPVAEIAGTAVDNLLALMGATGTLPGPRSHLIDPELLVRRSTAALNET